jgi:hypothetical protein
MNSNWSIEYEFTQESIKKNVPSRSGVFRIIQSKYYNRYKENTRILNIAKSETNLQAELLNRFGRHTISNRLSRIRNQPGIKVTFDYFLETPKNTEEMENHLLREFEDIYWDLPVLNSQRGYSRNADSHYSQG